MTPSRLDADAAKRRKPERDAPALGIRALSFVLAVPRAMLLRDVVSVEVGNVIEIFRASRGALYAQQPRQ